MLTVYFPSSDVGGGLPNPPMDADPPDVETSAVRQTPWMQTPLDVGHVTCDARC